MLHVDGRLRGASEEITQVSIAAIGPELAATIMLLIADRVADAAQMSRSIRFDNSSMAVDQLRHAIAQLAQGNLESIQTSTWLPDEAREHGQDTDAVKEV